MKKIIGILFALGIAQSLLTMGEEGVIGRRRQPEEGEQPRARAQYRVDIVQRPSAGTSQVSPFHPGEIHYHKQSAPPTPLKPWIFKRQTYTPISPLEASPKELKNLRAQTQKQNIRQINIEAGKGSQPQQNLPTRIISPEPPPVPFGWHREPYYEKIAQEKIAEEEKVRASGTGGFPTEGKPTEKSFPKQKGILKKTGAPIEKPKEVTFASKVQEKFMTPASKQPQIPQPQPQREIPRGVKPLVPQRIVTQPVTKTVVVPEQMFKNSPRVQQQIRQGAKVELYKPVPRNPSQMR